MTDLHPAITILFAVICLIIACACGSRNRVVGLLLWAALAVAIVAIAATRFA